MKEWLRQFYTFVIAVAGQIVILCLLAGTRPGEFSGPDIDPKLVMIRSIALAAGTVMLLFILGRFILKYRKNPSTARMNTLLAIISFIIATSSYFISTTFNFPGQIVDRFFTDTTNIFVIVGVYLFLIFGISFFMASAHEKPLRLLKFVLNIGLIAIYAGLMILKLADLAGVNPNSTSALDRILLYTIFAFGGVCLVLMVYIAVKALIISRKIEEPVYKKGLTALGLSYLLLTAGIVVLIISILVETSDKSLIVAVIILLGVAFYFIYEGFVKPSGQNQANT